MRFEGEILFFQTATGFRKRFVDAELHRSPQRSPHLSPVLAEIY